MLRTWVAWILNLSQLCDNLDKVIFTWNPPFKIQCNHKSLWSVYVNFDFQMSLFRLYATLWFWRNYFGKIWSNSLISEVLPELLILVLVEILVCWRIYSVQSYKNSEELIAPFGLILLMFKRVKIQMKQLRASDLVTRTLNSRNPKQKKKHWSKRCPFGVFSLYRPAIP